MNWPQPANHIDQMMRQTRAHHVQLSSMADVKANIMLSLASLVTTFSLSHLSDPLLRWPILILIVFCLLTILFAAYAVMPKLNFDFRPNLKDLQCNILFFGTFMNLGYEEYARAMEEVLNEPARVYEAQVREVYELGIYLGYKKYRYVRMAYITFIVGLVASGAMLIVVELATVLG